MTNQIIETAIALYKEARQFHRQAGELTREVARAVSGNPAGDHREAIKEAATKSVGTVQRLEQIIALGEDNETLRQHRVYALAHRNLGLLWRASGTSKKRLPGHLYESVIAHLTTALDLGAERDAAVCRTLGTAYFHAGRHRQAAELLLEAVELNERDVVTRVNLCLSYLALGERERAQEQYRMMQSLRPSRNQRYRLFAPMLEQQLARPDAPKDEAEQEELRRFIAGFRRLKE
jgi:tetratricopeptide (TPR) repeat protein